MTKRECAVITAYTDVTMLNGNDLSYLYDYLSGIIGRPVYSHEIPAVIEQYKKTIIKNDFLSLCKNATEETADEKYPYVQKETLPTVAGVVVVAEGGGNPAAVSEISESVQALLKVEPHRIRVVKMCSREESE